MKELLNHAPSELKKTKWSCIQWKRFWRNELTEWSKGLWTSRRNNRRTSTPMKKKVFEEQQGIFRKLLIEKCNNLTNSPWDEINNAKVQIFWKKVSKVNKIYMSQSIAPLKNESSYLEENSDKAGLLTKSFSKAGSGQSLVSKRPSKSRSTKTWNNSLYKLAIKRTGSMTPWTGRK